MKTDKFFALCALIPLILALSGCGMFFAQSLDPASSRATVSMRLGTLQADSSGTVSRAIVQGDGYLYIRTIGGPTGSIGPFYGPYSVSSGSTFTTTDIPAGTYSKLFVIYSGKLLDSPTKYSVLGGSYSFTEFMSAPDSLLGAFLDEVDTDTKTTDSGKEDLGNSFDGMASYGLKRDLSLPASGTTNLTMILSPISSSGTEIQLWQNPSFTFSSTDQVKRFYRLDGISVKVPVTAGNLSCKLFADSATSGTVGTVAFFDSDGNQVSATKTGSSLTGGYTWTIEPAAINAAVTHQENGYGYVELIMYIEFQGTVYARFANTVPPNVYISVDGDATSSWKGHKMLFGIYDSTAYANISAGQSWDTQSPIGLGIVNLDSTTGDGALTTMVSSLTPGATYYISAQVDTGDHYASLTDFGSVDLVTIVPYQNDLLTNGVGNGLLPFTAGSAVSLSASNFMPYTDYVYFVSSAGGGTGATPASPMTFTSALGSSKPSQIYLLESISGLSGQSVTGSVSISSYGRNVYTLSPQSYLSAMAFFQVNSSSSLDFERVLLDCSGVTGAMQSFLYMADGSNASLTLGVFSALKGSSSASTSLGGGVYVGSGSTFTMIGSTIHSCMSTSSGGAIYVRGAAGVTTQAIIGPGATFSYNTSGSGGAIYVERYGYARLESSTFNNNVVNVAGNGVICVDGTVDAKALSFVSNTADNNYVLLVNGAWNNLP